MCSRSRALEAGHWLREGDRDDEGAANRCAAVARCPHLETIRIGPLQQLVPPACRLIQASSPFSVDPHDSIVFRQAPRRPKPHVTLALNQENRPVVTVRVILISAAIEP